MFWTKPCLTSIDFTFWFINQKKKKKQLAKFLHVSQHPTDSFSQKSPNMAAEDQHLSAPPCSQVMPTKVTKRQISQC